MLSSKAIRVFCLALLGVTMMSSVDAIDRPLSVESLDFETRKILNEKNRIEAFISAFDGKTRAAVDKFLAISPDGNDLAKNRIVGPETAAPYIVRATVPVGNSVSVFYSDSTIVFLSSIPKDQSRIEFENLYIVVYVPRDQIRGIIPVKRVVSAVHTISPTY